ncbi:MAG: hypothetical protein KDC45_00590, partial [Bacteroidetes bacterium]|nr:hypothetical protein [Bacteroidota bacterium]
ARRLFDARVAILSSLITTVSVYSVYWSRVCRNYASFELFYLVMVIIFWKAFEAPSRKEEGGSSWIRRQGIDLRWMAAFPVALVAAMLNHQLTFFFAFSIAVYASVVALSDIWFKRPGRWSSKYAVVLYPTLLFGFLFNTPVMAEYIIKPIAGLVLHEEGILWFIPRWDIIFGVWASPQKFRVLDIYLDVMKADFPAIWWLALPGFGMAIWLKRREGLFLFAAFAVPFLLMSFVFYDPAASRYLLYLYPFFAMALSAAFIGVLVFLEQNLIGIGQRGTLQYSVFAGVAVLVLYLSPLKEVKALLTVQRHGLVSKPEISNWYFSNWRSAGEMMKSQIQKGDIVFSTMPSGTNHYLGIDSSLWFRQMHYSEYVKKYISNEPQDTHDPNATTFENLVATVSNYPRGWVFADYYFYNVMTDPRAREFVMKNLHYHFDASQDGTVQVFSWDREQVEPPKGLFAELGKQPEMMASQPYSVALEDLDNTKNVTLVMDCEAIDDPKEAYVLINQSRSVFLPVCRTTSRETVRMNLDPSWFKSGVNTLQFAYNRQVGTDIRKGYAIYNVSIGQ